MNVPQTCLGIVIAGLLGAMPARAADRALELAVDRALAFLANTQDRETGAWAGGRSGRGPAVTALGVMAFLSAGHIPGEGKYGDIVERGTRWVLRSQQPNGLIAPDGGHEMYHHGISTLMLAEVCGMVDGSLGEEVRRRLERAILVTLKGQRREGVHRGGWRYTVQGYDSDISVTGWQLMSLRAAKNLGCDVPPEAIDRAVEYVKRCQDLQTGAFRYFPGGPPTVPCTGTSILGLEICGRDHHRSPEVLKGVGYLLRSPPVWGRGERHFFYSVYYGSQATFQLGGQYWNSYREQLHRSLLPNQQENGGWFAADPEGQVYGPNYCTAMGILALTVEYRFLPIYQRGEEPPERGR